MRFSANPDAGATLGLTAHLIPQVNLGLNALDNTTSASLYLYFDASFGLQGNISSGKKPQPCLTGNSEINVEVGTQDSFFDIFSNSTGQSLFEKNFTLFQVRAYCTLSTFFFFEYSSFPLHDDSTASPGTRLYRIRVRQIQVRQVRLLSSVHMPTCYSHVSDCCFPAFARSSLSSSTLCIHTCVFSPHLVLISGAMIDQNHHRVVFFPVRPIVCLFACLFVYSRASSPSRPAMLLPSIMRYYCQRIHSPAYKSEFFPW